MSVAPNRGMTLRLIVLVCGIVMVAGAALGARFGPIMVLNSTNLPMDFRRFMDQSQSSNLHVDTWSLLGSPKELVRSDMVNLNTLVEEPCDSTSAEARRYDPSGDCLLMDLLDRFDPRDPDFEALNRRSRAPDAGAGLSIPTGDRNPGVRPRLKFDSQTKT
jgi:hypothetical protein